MIRIINASFNIPKNEVENQEEDPPISYNIVLLGNSNVGKTSIFERLSKDIDVFAGVFLVLGLLGLEKFYKQDEGKDIITSIELLVMSFYSLSIMHITALIKFEFIKYMYFSAGTMGL